MSCNFNLVNKLFLLSRNNRETLKDTHLANIARKIQESLYCETEIFSVEKILVVELCSADHRKTSSETRALN